jgi:hypothetical protein
MMAVLATPNIAAIEVVIFAAVGAPKETPFALKLCQRVDEMVVHRMALFHSVTLRRTALAPVTAARW